MTKEELKEHCAACFALGVLQGAIMVSVSDKMVTISLVRYVNEVYERLLSIAQDKGTNGQ